MKKLILIVLLAFMCMSVINVAVAKVKFANWDRWEEEFPPKDYWKDSIGFLREIIYLDNKTPICIAMNRYMENEKGDEICIILFSPFGENPETIIKGTANYKFALVAFPPKKGEITIRAYKNDDKILKFFEDWKILFRNHEEAVLKDTKFRQVFKKWAATEVSIKLIVFEKQKFTLLFDFETEKKDILDYLKKAL